MFSFPRLTPFVKKLLVALLAVFVIELVLQNWVAGVPLFSLLALSHGDPGLHTIWQVLTYAVVWPPVPQSVANVLLGLLFLWWMLAPFEERFGARRTIQLCLAAVLAAALPALAVGLLFPRGEPPLYGFDPVILASIAAFAYSMRGRGQMSFFGVLPMSATALLWVVVGFSVLMFLASMNVTELAADLGAIGGGVLFVRFIQRPRRSRARRSKSTRPPLGVIRGGRGDDDKPKYLN